MKSRKADHLRERIRQKLGLILQREANDPRFARVTLTEVKLSKDRAYAKVRYTCYQHEDDIESLTASLNRAAGFLGHALGRTLETRTTPRLQFEYDPGLDYAQEIDLALARLRKKEE